MTDSLAWLQDSSDVRVVEGLTRRCSLCGAKKGDWCVKLGTKERRPELHQWRAGEAA